MDRTKVSQMAAVILSASEAVSVSGRANRGFMDSIARAAEEILAEVNKEGEDG